MVASMSERMPAPDEVRAPSVLAVLVAHDGAPWLRECLHSLAEQTYRPFGIVAVDVGSADGSGDLLRQALGDGRVLTIGRDAGLAGALRAALDVPAASAADYVLLVHDDTSLAPDAVARLIDAAVGIEGVGIVGPKVVDWDDPRILRDVGGSADRFGHPYSPLQEGEMDQGQYDRVLEVLYVSSCAMLVSREAWQRTGTLDERLAGHHDDLDFCWRGRVAGFRVLMTPLAQARHRDARASGARAEDRRRSRQYQAERAALAGMLKNYGLASLVWLLPLDVVFGVVRALYLVVSRRLEDAYELVSAWAWNVVHLPSTLRRRVRTQSVRRAPDRAVRRFMQSALIRVPRWFQVAERILEEQAAEDLDRVPVRARARSLASEHPVLVGWAVGAVAALLAYRVLTSPGPLHGGALPSFPGEAMPYFRELVSAVRTTGLGGAQAASPALAVLGALVGLPGVDGAVVQKALLAVLPPLAAVVLYRGLVRQTADRAASVVGSVGFGVSAIAFWAFSDGRIAFLVALVVIAAMFDRVDAAFDARHAVSLRWVVASGAVLAAGVAFDPGVVLPIAAMAAVGSVTGPRRARGFVASLAVAAAGAALVFPLLPEIARVPSAALGSWLGSPSFDRLGRLSPGVAPGGWVAAWFLPVAAAIALSVVGPSVRRRAWRAMILAAGGVFLAWASAAGWLPREVANAPMYLGLAAVAEASILAYGVATIGAGMQRQAFGYRQVAVGALALVMVVGVGAQVLEAAIGGWSIGAEGLPSAWPVIQNAPATARILWIGRPDGSRFPAPGGDPVGEVQAGAASVRYAITGRDGVSALDTGRPDGGPGFAYAGRALGELLAGGTSHAGALLAPLGVRFVVARSGDLPPATRARLDAQLDLDLVPAGGLVIYRNARVLPTAFVTSSRSFEAASRGADLIRIASVGDVPTTPLEASGSGWSGASDGGTAYVADQFAAGWRAEPSGDGARTAFGWATAFDAPRGDLRIAYGDQRVRTAEIGLLAVLWLGVLWVTRRPGSR